MIKTIVIVCIFLLGSKNLFATMFSKMTFEKQVEEASSAAETRLKDIHVFKKDNGMIMTEYQFEIIESFNISKEDLEGQELKLTMPGGSLDGVTSMIDGAPHFEIGEKSFLLLKKVNSKIYLSNFTLGKYTIQNIDGKIFYISEVFPNDPQVGKITKEKMHEIIQNVWKVSFIPHSQTLEKTVLLNDEISPTILKQMEPESRSPAQLEEKNEGVPLFFWGALICVIFFFSLIFTKLGQSGRQHKCE